MYWKDAAVHKSWFKVELKAIRKYTAEALFIADVNYIFLAEMCMSQGRPSDLHTLQTLKHDSFKFHGLLNGTEQARDPISCNWYRESSQQLLYHSLSLQSPLHQMAWTCCAHQLLNLVSLPCSSPGTPINNGA